MGCPGTSSTRDMVAGSLHEVLNPTEPSKLLYIRIIGTPARFTFDKDPFDQRMGLFDPGRLCVGILVGAKTK